MSESTKLLQNLKTLMESPTYSTNKEAEAKFQKLCKKYPDHVEMLGYHKPLVNPECFNRAPDEAFHTAITLREKCYRYRSVWLLDYLVTVDRMRYYKIISEEECDYFYILLLSLDKEDVQVGLALLNAPLMKKKILIYIKWIKRKDFTAYPGR